MMSWITAVERVGKELLAWRDRQGREGVWQGTQFKAVADRLAQEALTGALARERPALPIVSEEDEASQADGRPAEYWLIDPLDGTASYAGGFDGFVTQVARMDADGPREAVVVAPALGLTYSARRGAGAWCNGRRLVLTPRPPRVLVDNYPQPRGVASELYTGLGFATYLESGSIGLKICRVADGMADLFFKDVVVRDWDLAAPHLVLAEAGGILTDVHARPFGYQGAYAREGLIAARTADLHQRAADWYRAREQAGGGAASRSDQTSAATPGRRAKTT